MKTTSRYRRARRGCIRRAAPVEPGVDKIFTVGFCFGGRNSFNQAARGHGLSGVIGFYGSVVPRNEEDIDAPIDKVASFECPVLGLFGGADQMITADGIEAFGTALDDAGVANELKIYDGAPHSFFDRAFDQFAADCDDAWTRILSFIRDATPRGRGLLMARAEANGIEIEYETFGDATNPTLLLVMGLGAQLIAWPDDVLPAARRPRASSSSATTTVTSVCPRSSSRIRSRTPPRRSAAAATPAYTLDDMADDGAGAARRARTSTPRTSSVHRWAG